MDFTNLWSGLDWAIVVAYIVGVLMVGWVFRTRAGKNLQSFFLAARTLTIPVLVGTAAASWYESWTVVGLASEAWHTGIFVLVWYVVPTALLRIPLATWIAPYVRDEIPEHVVTLPDLLSYLYDKRSGVLGAVFVVTTVLYSGALLFAVGEVLHLVSGLPLWVGMVVAGIVVGIYTMWGGLWSVAATDVIQFAIMTICAALVIPGIMNLIGGWDGLSEALAKQDPILLTPSGGQSVASILAWVVAAFALYTSPQSYQRFSASRSGAESRVAYNIVLALGIGYSAVWVFSGLSARALYPDLPAATGFWRVIFSVLPMGMRGLFVAGLTAAVMSTIDSDFLISSTVLIKNLYADLINPKASEQSLIAANRITVLILSIIMVLCTQLWYGGIQRAWYYIGGFETAAFIVPLVGGLFYKRKTKTGGFIALLAGVVFYPVWEFVLKAPFGVPSNVSTWVVSAIVYFVVCELTYQRPQAQRVGEGI